MPITSVNGSERGQAKQVGEINEHAEERLFSIDDLIYCCVLPVAALHEHLYARKQESVQTV